MKEFFSVIGGCLIAVVLSLSLKKQGKDISLLLTVCVGIIVLTASVGFLNPVISFVRKLQSLSGMDENLLTVILKVVGIGIVSEFAGMICTDAGENAMAKAIGVFSTGVILWLSLPLWEALVELIQKIVGEA